MELFLLGPLQDRALCIQILRVLVESLSREDSQKPEHELYSRQTQGP